MAFYRWLGRKPLQRAHNIMSTLARDKGKPIGVEYAEVHHGQVFDATEAEVVSFSDLMEPVGDSLRVAEPVGSGVGADDAEE